MWTVWGVFVWKMRKSGLEFSCVYEHAVHACVLPSAHVSPVSCTLLNSQLELVYSAQVLQHQQQLCRDHEPVALSVEVGVHLLLHSL